MLIAAIQMVSTPDVARNLDVAERLIGEAAAQGATLVALPEYFCLMGRQDRDKLAIAERFGDVANEAAAPTAAAAAVAAPIQTMLARAAHTHGVWLIGGTLPLRLDDGTDTPERVANANLAYAPDGSLAARYDKIHLFRFASGTESYDEGRVLQAGTEPVAVQAGDLRVGLSICYDLRFPELYRSLMTPPCDLLSVPSAFTYTTGQAHWELLLRTRAVENQCYVIAPAQGGTHENGRRTWGHSMVVDPWGKVLAMREEGEGVVIAELDPARIADVRRQLPALAHRRGL